jgi:hypothetical protein
MISADIPLPGEEEGIFHYIQPCLHTNVPRFMDLRNMSEQLVKENYHARAQVETREKQIMARWQVSPSSQTL